MVYILDNMLEGDKDYEENWSKKEGKECPYNDLQFLNFMARVGHFEVIFAQTLERGERASHVPIW